MSWKVWKSRLRNLLRTSSMWFFLKAMLISATVQLKFCKRQVALSRACLPRTSSRCTRGIAAWWGSGPSRGSSHLIWASIEVVRKASLLSAVKMYTSIWSTSQVYTKCSVSPRRKKQAVFTRAQRSSSWSPKCRVSSPWTWKTSDLTSWELRELVDSMWTRLIVLVEPLTHRLESCLFLKSTENNQRIKRQHSTR